MATLARDLYRRKVYGCWLGKTIGGTLGQPHEGKKQLLELDFYDPVPEGAIANDDLDLQLVWLAALREVGPDTDERVLGDYWLRSLQYPFDEYGIAMWNLGRGIVPPVSGQFANHFSDCMGAPIRSEIWACCAPGCPALAAEYGYYDGCVDHGGEGIYGEMFFAALESAAFVIDDTDTLLDIGLSLIPSECRTAGAVRLTRRLHADGLDWLAARERILAEYGHVNFTDAPQNIAFTILGWLWGEDAGDAMCKAVNCGYDTDCTGATLGSILGIIHGPEVFDERWKAPVGDEIVVGWGVHHCECPSTLPEMSEWTLEVAEKVMAARNATVRLGDTTDLAGLDPADLAHAERLEERLRHHDWTICDRRDGDALWVHLGGPPALEPGETRVVTVTGARGEVRLGDAPDGWSGRAGEGGTIVLEAPDTLGDSASYALELTVNRRSVPLALVPACGWKVAGPVEVADAKAALDNPPALPEGRGWWTADHRLRLEDEAATARVYRIETTLWVPSDRQARLVVATPQLQRVWLDGEEVIRKEEPTGFIPAPHRSGPGTVVDDRAWSAGEHGLEILLAVPPGQPAEVHVMLTQPRSIDGPRMVPLSDWVLRQP